MFRRCLIDSTLIIRGRPFKKRGMPIAVHASEMPAKPSDIDFTSLGLTFPMSHTPKVVVKEFYMTARPDTAPIGLPFAVERTSVGNGLPIYTDYKGGKTKVVTILRKCRGDIEALKIEMGKVCDGNEITVRPGKLVVDGNFHIRLKKWLAGLGF